MTAFDKAFETVQQLVNTFNSNYTHYMSPTYSEAEARQDFIDNFFIALGWDVNHKQQTNPYEQEVKIERSQKQQNESARKRADYAFFTTPNFKDEVFFAEAKKPSVLIQNNPQHYFQTIKYGWNSGCPICVLTDFEELAIIDCRQKPDLKYALNGKHKTYSYNDYVNKEKFAEIYWLFSREAVINNSLQKYATTLPKPKGKVVQKALFKGSYQAIDDSFLEYIDGIRENIAKAFKKANENLNSEQLTEATQRTVDRLVFIRFLEDKFIEAAEHVSEWKSWNDFISDCRKLDAKYNGVVFKKHFIDEPHFLGADENLFLDICSDISNLNSPYDFNYIPIHILGSIYERFLGKVVRATDKRVVIEEKPEVRKAGGVYYTPKYIVDYIVQHTVGKIIDGLTPAQIAGKVNNTSPQPLSKGEGQAAPLAFADIACGSGSFLIGVYDCLLDYHKKYYTQKLQGKTEIDKRSEDYGNVEYKDGQWRLTLKLKQNILLNNIYGVDIDAQAVEVTQLSLFLKMLDEESVSSTQAQQGAMFSKVLPDLSKNIVCGNSLIGFDIMNGQLFEDAELKKLNPMDYETAFPKIMRDGGFDAVVGNPPYIRIQSILETSPFQADYFGRKYHSAKKGNYDIYVAFVERAFLMLKQKGKLGYILPHKFFTALYVESLREFLLQRKALDKIIHFGHQQIFEGATTYTCILILENNSSKKQFEFEKIDSIKEWSNNFDDKSSFISFDTLSKSEWNFVSQIDLNLFEKLNTIPLKLEGVTNRIFQGLKTGADKVFITKKIKETSSHFTVFSFQLNKEIELEKDLLKPLVKGGNSTKYLFSNSGLLILFPYSKENHSTVLISEEKLMINYPLCYDYLKENKNILLKRDGGKIKHKEWYCFSRNQALDIISEKKIFTPDISPSASFSLDENGKIFFTGGVAGGYGITPSDGYTMNCLLGLLNSSLLDWYLKKISTQMRGGWYSYEAKYIKKLPIIAKNKETKNTYSQLVELVTQMLSSKKQLAAAITDSDKNFLQNKCNSLDRQIDNLVYVLYGLSEEEVRIVEGG